VLIRTAAGPTSTGQCRFNGGPYAGFTFAGTPGNATACPPAVTHAGDVANQNLAGTETVADRAMRRQRDPTAAVVLDEVADHGPTVTRPGSWCHGRKLLIALSSFGSLP
jgi:hypothetical protein